jgi:hypothetical protein
MRLLSLLLVGASLVLPLSVQAAPGAMPTPDMNSSSDIVQVAGPRCGPHAHYVRGHRNHEGHYIKGRCVRDRRH